jgi:hypothetical protein
MKIRRTSWFLIMAATLPWASAGCSSKASSSDAATSLDAAVSTGGSGGMAGAGGAGGAGGADGVGGAGGTGGSGTAGRSTAMDDGGDAAGGAGGSRGTGDTLVCPGETQGTWVAMSTTSAPRGTASPNLLWTGTELYIYDFAYGAGLFDPCANAWQTSPTPVGYEFVVPIPAANKVLFFAPTRAQFEGFDYRQNQVLPLSLAGASQASYATVVSTGAKLIEWGGAIVTSAPDAGSRLVGTQTGAIYDPASNAWTAMSTKGAPAARVAPGAWTGSQLAIWGGHSADTSWTDAGRNECVVSDYVNQASGCLQYGDGALYDPARDVWTPMAATGAPKPRFDHLLVWTGDRVLVWGGGEQGLPDSTLGSSGEQCLNDGGLYDPVAQTWTTVAASPPSLRTDICLGVSRLLWTGDYLATDEDVDAVWWLFDPHSNSWSTLDLPGTAPVTNCEVSMAAQAGALVAVCTVDSVRTLVLRPAGEKAWRSYPLPSDVAQGPHLLWTGRRLFVWGGTVPSTFKCPPPTQQPGCDPPPPNYSNAGYMLVP